MSNKRIGQLRCLESIKTLSHEVLSLAKIIYSIESINMTIATVNISR